MTTPVDPSLSKLLQSYPKIRPELPPAMQAIYANQYVENRSGASPAASVAQRLEGWMHAQVAADLEDGRPRSTLELGAGTLNQLAFEPPSDAPYDVVEPFQELLDAAKDRSRVRDVFADTAEVPVDRRYDRITSVAALEHICDLPRVLARSAVLLAPGGTFRAAVPAEGGLLWTLGWRLTTGLEFRMRHGLDYGLMMAHEHVNTAAEIETLVGAVFDHARIRSFGVGRQLSLYRFIEAKGPRADVAADWSRRFG